MRVFEQVEITSRDEWRSWLGAHHRQSDSVWVITFKKGKGPYVPYPALVEEALCFGWIDSLPRRLDDARTMLLMSPRRPGSGWSKTNKDRTEQLAAADLLAPSGVATIDAAKADGSWRRLDAVDALEIPEDLAEALAAYPPAAETFGTFPPSVRRGILEWVSQAKRAATRMERIRKTAEAAAAGRRAGGWPSR